MNSKGCEATCVCILQMCFSSTLVQAFQLKHMTCRLPHDRTGTRCFRLYRFHMPWRFFDGSWLHRFLNRLRRGRWFLYFHRGFRDGLFDDDELLLARRFVLRSRWSSALSFWFCGFGFGRLWLDFRFCWLGFCYFWFSFSNNVDNWLVHFVNTARFLDDGRTTERTPTINGGLEERLLRSCLLARSQ